MLQKIRLKTTLLLALIVLTSCDSENANDCFQTTGTFITKNIELTAFEKINISQGIELIVSQGSETQVSVHSGENLMNGITAEVTNGQLFLRNTNGCNLVRDYNTTKVYVTTPNLTNIYSSSQFAVKSSGTLRFPNLSLQSGLYSDTASGTFDVQVDCVNLHIEDNQSGYFKVSGTTHGLSIGFYDGNARFDGAQLVTNEVFFFQRSSNDIILNPIAKVSGTIYSTGNVILKNTPTTIDVTELYNGRLIYSLN